jgi:Spy/CpxP family protein refolding chaperone
MANEIGIQARKREGISIARIMGFRQELDLSDDQIADLRSVQADYIRGVIKRQADIRLAQLDLSEILRGENPDFEQARASVTRISEQKLQIQLAVLDTYHRGLSILSGKQRARLSQLVSPSMQYGMNLPLNDELEAG